jgi:hypothetical protein
LKADIYLLHQNKQTFIYLFMKTLVIYPNGQIFLTTNGKNEALTISQANEIFAKTKKAKQYILGEIKFYTLFINF